VHVFLATSWLDPLVGAVAWIIGAIDGVVHNRGWSLVLFALGLKLLFWPLNTKQFVSMVKMQQLAPQLTARYGVARLMRHPQFGRHLDERWSVRREPSRKSGGLEK